MTKSWHQRGLRLGVAVLLLGLGAATFPLWGAGPDCNNTPPPPPGPEYDRPEFPPKHAVRQERPDDEARNAEWRNRKAERQAEEEAMRQRRFEIMVLVQASRLVPEAEQSALRDEALKRIKADFAAALERQKARANRLEQELAKFRQEIAEREAQADKIAEAELQRLLTMPLDPPPAPGKDAEPGKAPRREKSAE